jgi:RHS repeat-associated protein
LEVDAFGNVLKQAAVGYGRRTSIRIVDAHGQSRSTSNPGFVGLTPTDQSKQTTALMTYSESRVTNAIDTFQAYRNPLPCEMRTFELTGYTPTGPAGRFQPSDLLEPDPNRPGRLRHTYIKEFAYEEAAIGNKSRRPIEWSRALYRKDALTALCSLGTVESLALTGESYKLAFTPGLLASVFRRPQLNKLSEALLPDPSAVLGGQGGDRGGYLQSQTLKADGRFPNDDADDHWWIPSGRAYFSTSAVDIPAVELTAAQNHFFIARRFRDPFGNDATVTFDSEDLLIVAARDALGNQTTVDRNDYRVLQPRIVSDANRNQTEVAIDTLGMVVGTAVMGKPIPAPIEGDSLSGFVADISQQSIDAFHDAVDPRANATNLLKDATTRIIYDVDRFQRTQLANPQDDTKWLPPYAATVARETHVHDQLPSQGLKIQIALSYSDGFGREIQKKIQAEPEKIDGLPGPPRWVANGWTIFNNKGKPVRQYEPFFSAVHKFEFGVTVGVSPLLLYDPANRVIATLHPNNTFEKFVFDPWQQTTYDVNDTVAPRNKQTGDPRTDADIGGYVFEFFKRQPANWTTWYAQRIGGALGTDEQVAASRAEAHADTPTTAHCDALGRAFLTISRNRVVCTGHALDGTEDSLSARVELDIEGNARVVRDATTTTKARDALGGSVDVNDPRGRVIMLYDYDLIGNRIYQLSMEAGARWILADVTDKPIRVWDSRGHVVSTTYDELRRPIEQYVRGTSPESDPRTLNRDLQVEKFEYGEGLIDAQSLNIRTRAYRHFDSAGITINARLQANGVPVEAFDFKGNALCVTRRLISDYTAIPDWLLNPSLDQESFESRTRYDALNRAIQAIMPHSTLSRANCNIIQPMFNAANLLERVDVWLDRNGAPNAMLDPNTEASARVGIDGVNYNAKGQRLVINYKNGTNTTYRYDPFTFRLTHLLTHRDPNEYPDDCRQPARSGWPGCQIQSLSYIYDPAGNVTHIQDDAQQAIYFRNKRVEPSNNYIYDSLYRLIEATGREHFGQGNTPTAHSHNDAERTGILSADGVGRFAPSDGNALGTYVERFVYDPVGNILDMQHRGSDPIHAGWTREYIYAETSQIEDGTGATSMKPNNRLTYTIVNPAGGAPLVESYTHDEHGNMISMPHLGSASSNRNLHWNYKDQLRRADLGGGGTAFYVYDGSGQRVRKVCEKSPGLTEERIYLGGMEIFRKHSGVIGNDTAVLERETVHITDDKQRIALIETRTLDLRQIDKAPLQLIRYQFGNHLGSASLELDQAAQVISYEEYSPYGSSTYQAVRSNTESAKRYRYTGQERDEESGLYYHGARYYAAWLGRWSSADPIGIQDGPNIFSYVSNKPIVMTDPSGHAGKEVAASLNDLILYADKVSNKAAVGANIQKDHAISQAILKEILGPLESLYKSGRDLTTVVETGAASGSSAARWHTIKSTLEKAVQTSVRALTSGGKGFSIGESVVAPVADVLKSASGATQLTRQQYLAVLSQLGNFHATTTTEQAGKLAAIIEGGDAAKLTAAVDKIASSTKGVAKWTKVLRGIANSENALAATSKLAIAGQATLSLVARAAPLLKTLAPVGRVLGRVAGPLGIGVAAVQFATAKNTEQKIDAGVTAVSSALLMSKHPVAIAAGAGLAVGGIIEKSLNVSEYSSQAGVAVYEKLKGAGLNDTASFVIGGVASVAAIPSAIGYAAAAKVSSWFK